MFDHTFSIVPHYRIGPLRNAQGFIIAVCEIGEVWMMRLEAPDGNNHCAYFNDYDEVLEVIKRLRFNNPMA